MKTHIPSISVVVPLFNREQFLPQLLSTLLNQTYTDFEVILIDDGSNDDTEKWINTYFSKSTLDFIYVYQENGGPYKARNTGLNLVRGKYISFFDSDDEWPDYHLDEFFKILDANQDIDWLFGSIKRIEHSSREVLNHNNFYDEHNQAHPLINLNTETRQIDGLTFHVLKDKRLAATIIEFTLPGSMQCSLIKREVFDSLTFDESYRTAYDRFFTMKSAIKGFNFAYIDKVHLIYHVHEDNISNVGRVSPNKLIASGKTMLRGYKKVVLMSESASQRHAATKRLSQIHAWQLAVAYQEKGEHIQAIKSFKNALRLAPMNFLYIKSLAVAVVKLLLSSLK